MANKEWYYQIKGKLSEPGSGLYGGSTNWSFPPIFSGKVSAESKKDAHKLINEDYGKQFPLKVLAKDLESNEFLLNITEITDDRTRSLFIERECLQCGVGFKIIDSYNDPYCTYKGPDFCSGKCKTERYEVEKFLDNGNNELGGYRQPVIYRVLNTKTNLCYIGKTTQPFTLRWYQHFYHGGETKFHQAIKNTNLEEWTFSVIEKISIPPDIKSKAEIEKLIFERERFWINQLDSVNNGYNSL